MKMTIAELRQIVDKLAADYTDLLEINVDFHSIGIGPIAMMILEKSRSQSIALEPNLGMIVLGPIDTLCGHCQSGCCKSCIGTDSDRGWKCGCPCNNNRHPFTYCQPSEDVGPCESNTDDQ